MKSPCVSVDVSKGKSHFQGWIDVDHKCGNPKCISHTKSGFDEILKKLKELEGITNEKPIVTFESTGVYHKNLQTYLDEKNIKYVIISPLVSAKVRKSNLRSTKTDRKDCKTIARAYFEKNFFIHQKSDEIYENLRNMNRYYQYLVKQLTKMKYQYKSYLSVLFPNYEEVHVKTYNEISLSLFKKFHHPDEIKNKKPESLAKYLEKTTCHKYDYCYREAKAIIEFCNNCQAGCFKNDMICDLFAIVVEQVIQKKEEKELFEKQFIDYAKAIDNYSLLVTIPGIKGNIASRLLAEIGDISRFKNAHSLIAYAGIDPNVYQSGEKGGLHLKITKKGNKNLRTILYQAIENSLKSNNKISDYYKRKIATGMNSEVAKVACMNKLVRIIYSMCKFGLAFQNQ